jgi:hypothetical protein
MAINGWNRTSVALQTAPASCDRMFGLDKANLA